MPAARTGPFPTPARLTGVPTFPHAPGVPPASFARHNSTRFSPAPPMSETVQVIDTAPPNVKEFGVTTKPLTVGLVVAMMGTPS